MSRPPKHRTGAARGGAAKSAGNAAGPKSKEANAPATQSPALAGDEGRLPSLLMGCAALFGVWGIASATLHPPQAYPEYAPSWHMLAMAVGGIAIAAALLERLDVRWPLRAFAALVAFQALAWHSTQRGQFPFAGHEWLATLAQSAAFLALGGCLGAHFGERGCDSSRDAFARAILWGMVALAAYHVYEALRQHFVVFPTQLRAYLNAAAAGGPLPPEFADAGPDLARRMAHGLSTGRVSSRFGNPNILAGVLAILWAAGPALWALERGRWRWSALAVSGVASPAILWLTGSRGGILTFGFAIALGLALAGRALRWRGVATWIGAAAAGLLLGAILGRTAPARALGQTPEAARLLNVDARGQAEGEESRFRRSSTIQQRLGFLKMGAAMARDAGALGFGAGSYEFLFARYQTPRQQESQHAHCAPLDLVVEHGWLGLAVWLAFLALLLPSLLPDLPRPWRRGTDEEVFGAAQALAAARFVAVAVFLANGLVELTFWQREVNLVVWFLAGAALRQGATREDAQPLDRKLALAFAIAAIPLAGLFGWMSFDRLRSAELIARAETPAEMREASNRFPEWHVPHVRLAAAFLEAARDGSPANVGAGKDAGTAWRAVAEFELRTARSLHPTSARLALQLVRVLIELGGDERIAEAEALTREAEKLAPRSSGVYAESAAIWRALGNQAEAERSERLAAEFDHEAGP